MKKTEEELQALANQLSCPNGDVGKALGTTMHETNIGMIRAAIELLTIEDEQSILELGHGNAAHLSEILEKASNLRYTGLELSGTMQEEAMRLNHSFVEASVATFYCYDGKRIPFEANQFDRIMTVNTIYFWQNTLAVFKDLYRVLNVGGVLAVAYANKDFMQNLPFVKGNFKLFDESALRKIVAQTKFHWIESIRKTEFVKSKTGELVNRSFTVVVLQKT